MALMGTYVQSASTVLVEQSLLLHALLAPTWIRLESQQSQTASPALLGQSATQGA